MFQVSDRKTVHLILEGNIGSGKSSFLHKCSTEIDDLTVLQEPVDKWTNVAGKHNLLKLMYEYVGNLFLFQVFANFTLYQNHLRVVDTKFKLQERSILSAKHVFLKNATTLLAPEMDTLLDMITSQENSLRIDLLVYIRTPPQICLDRIKHRDRHGERSIDIEYLNKLHNLHETWMHETKLPILILDGTRPTEELVKFFKICLSSF